MLRKSIFALLFSLMLTSAAFADIAIYVTKQQADYAVTSLKTTTQIKHFCPPCKDKSIQTEQIKTVSAEKLDSADYWGVRVNDNRIDLAYVYFLTDTGGWRNLAFQVGLLYDDIPRYLTAVQAPPAQIPPTSVIPNKAASGKVDWMPVVEMNNQIFPAFFLATATTPMIESKLPGVIGDAEGKIGVHIINPKANTKLKISYEIDSVVRLQEFETTLSEKDKYYQIYPRIIWNWEALKRFKKASPANASFSLYLDGKLVEKKSLVVRIRSINEAVYSYSYLLDENRWANTSWLFAAYVNEDHEWIDQILKDALNTKVVNSFIGYQGKPEQVIEQVFAIWYVLQRRGFKYSSITNTSGSGTTDKVFSQYVRLFDEAINASQANCVDGTVLIASILKKIGFRVGLVLIPGHCFLVFDADGKGNWKGLETTMIGNVDLSRFPDEAGKIDAAIKGFLDAVAVGNKTFTESLVKINENNPQYKFVDIDQARRNNVFPIAW